MTSDTLPVVPGTATAENSVPVSAGPPARPVTTGVLLPLGLSEVVITGGLLGHLQNRNHEVSLAHIEGWLETAGWLGNFDAATQGRLPADRQGREFADSEVYKFLEALAWDHGRTGEDQLDKRFRAIADRVLAAQETDGYLNTNFGRPGQQPRYSDLEWGHELYCFGHLIQAGVARARTAGVDDPFVQAVRRAADHVCAVFGVDGIASVCGHPVIEPALVELFRVTGDRRYLDQARLFVERRGHQVLADPEFGRSYFQDDEPVRTADVLRGHAVRALYLSAGAVDVAVETGDDELLAALRQQWDRTVSARTYLTGGMGARHQDEAFAEDFVLPADRAYAETCAGVASVMFSWRLLLAGGDVRHADLIERTLYNLLAASPSTEGDRFFYTNTLHQRELGVVPAADEQVQRAASNLRAPWFSVSCCPTNLARTFASLGAYVATKNVAGLQLHHYAPARIRTELPDGRSVGIDVTTDYPVSGRVRVRIVGDTEGSWVLSLRVPAWAESAQVSVNGAAPVTVPSGYAQVARAFADGDVVELELPMQPRFTRADPRVDAVRGCVAVERGPEVLCLESVDIPGRRHVDLFEVEATSVPELDERGVIVTLRPLWPRVTRAWPYVSVTPATDGADLGDERPTPYRILVPVRPYREWGNRGPSTMRVWLPVAAPLSPRSG